MYSLFLRAWWPVSESSILELKALFPEVLITYVPVKVRRDRVEEISTAIEGETTARFAGGPTTAVFGIGKRSELLSLWLESTIEQAVNAALALPP
jgi:hypothetical protein